MSLPLTFIVKSIPIADWHRARAFLTDTGLEKHLLGHAHATLHSIICARIVIFITFHKMVSTVHLIKNNRKLSLTEYDTTIRNIE
jgi:hypothetical protein